MRKLSGYGPSLIVLGTAALVLFVGPKAVQQLTYEQTRTRIIQASHNLQSTDVLQEINQAYSDVATMVEPSVVHVSAQYTDTDSLGIERAGLSTGSGWLFDDQGHIVTNNHVIQNAERIDVQLYNGDLRSAELVGADPSTDIAVIKIAPGRLHPATLAEPGTRINQGDLVFAFGSPFDFRFSMSSGVVSGKDRSVGVNDSGHQLRYENFIQVDAAINPGNSGGPLTDYRGHVIGMNTAIATGRKSFEEGQFAGIGLAIPMDMIQPVVTQILKNGFVEKGWLGVTIDQHFEPGAAQVLGFIGQGVRLQSVDPSGPAAHAGVQVGDIITSINSTPIASFGQLQSMVSSMLPGTTARLTLWRYDAQKGEGGALEIPVPLNRLDLLRAAGELPLDQPHDSIIGLGIAKMSSSTPELAAQLGAAFHSGVMIEDIIVDSKLARRMRRGTTIVSVMDRSVASVDDFIKVLRDYNLTRGVSAEAYDPGDKRIIIPLKVE